MRVGYPGGIEVTDRKKIKEVLVEMTRAAAAAASSSAPGESGESG